MEAFLVKKEIKKEDEEEIQEEAEEEGEGEEEEEETKIIRNLKSAKSRGNYHEL